MASTRPVAPPPWHDLGDGITRIDSGYHGPGRVAFYLLVEGNQAAFVDTGTYSAVPIALAALRAQGLAPENVAYVIPTHVHLDHAGGVGALMREFPNARLVVHPRGTRHMIDPAKLIAGVAEIYGTERAEREFGKPMPVVIERVVEAPDGFRLALNGRPLLFLDTPGHARHHFCVVDERSGSIFAGDTFGVSYRDFDTARGAFILPTTSPVQFEPDALHRSVDRLAARRPRQILLTHFGAVEEIPRLAADMHDLIDAFVVLGRRVKDAGADRQRLLMDGQHAILLPRLRAHGCTFTDAQIYSLLKHDYDLNAQGIAVWLDRPAA
jgi:glyoxylase-like metal-dependent hydrolase (beta-lactamase superfamily II)